MPPIEDDFDELLETARDRLASNEGASDLWDSNDAVNKALVIHPGNAEAWLVKCQVMSALEDDASALAAVEMALRRAPRSAEAQYWRAAVLADMARYDDALRALERAFRNLSEDEDWLLEDLYCEKASILDAIGRRDEAVATFEAGLKKCPDSAILRAGLEPLVRERRRASFKLLPGGRA
jgi:tetratricopeptide (TPR) repeat protein